MDRMLGVALLGVSGLGACTGEGGPGSSPPDAAALVGVWEARIEKPFEEDDPEQFVYRIHSDGSALTAVACTLDRENAVFEGPIESFECAGEATAVPVVVTDDNVSIAFTLGDAASKLRLVISAWMGADACSGDAWLEKWADYATPFTATRLDLE